MIRIPTAQQVDMGLTHKSQINNLILKQIPSLLLPLCVLIALSLFTTIWYKLIIRRTARRVTNLCPIIANQINNL
jgi:hypothetical protein